MKNKKKKIVIKLSVRLSQIFITDVKGLQPHFCLSLALTVQIYNNMQKINGKWQVGQVEEQEEEEVEEEEEGDSFLNKIVLYHK